MTVYNGKHPTRVCVLTACHGEHIVHSWSGLLLAGTAMLVDKLIWNKSAFSISNRASWLLSDVVYTDRRCDFHICYCQTKWGSKWVSGEKRMTKKTLCNYWAKQIGPLLGTDISPANGDGEKLFKGNYISCIQFSSCINKWLGKVDWRKHKWVLDFTALVHSVLWRSRLTECIVG